MDEVLNESIIYQNPALCIKVYRFVISDLESQTSWHYHNEIEVIFVEQGIHELETQGKLYTLKRGDTVIVGSNELHRARNASKEDLVFFVMHVDLNAYFNPAMMMYYKSFSEVLHPLDSMNYIFSDSEAKKEIVDSITKIHEEILGQKKGYELAVSMYIQRFMLSLLRYDMEDRLQICNNQDIEFLQPIVNYIEEHLSDQINMQQVCSLVNMSYTYFSKVFKQKVGLSFTDFINRKRISKAELLLVTEHMQTQEIAEAVGIQNMTHFYELFKRYNKCTPRQYLDKMLSKNNI